MNELLSSKRYFGYIRVSTVRQGQISTSLAEQRSAIEQFAQNANLKIVNWFEERETAAKQGRPIFRNMVKLVKQGKAAGIIIYKIDRSARNLKDWAELGELIDSGVEVHFASDPIDLQSRSGRLAADIQAVVAADFIRNLREETKKGFYGRIKQGYYPLPAPLGYLNCGGGKAKAVDPVVAPLIKKMFHLYASGKFSLYSLATRMELEGLRARNGQTVSMRGVAHMLHNLFYTGIVRTKTSEEYFRGKHIPIISQELFEQVQSVFRGKSTRKSRSAYLSEVFLFRRLLTCSRCQNRLIGERQKGHLYYRCHRRICPQKTIREEEVEAQFTEMLNSLNNKKIENFEEKEQKEIADSKTTFRFVQSAILEYPQARYNRKRFIIAHLAENLLVKDKIVTIKLNGSYEFLKARNT